MYTCADCAIHGCEKGSHEGIPKNCPMQDQEKIEKIVERYKAEDTLDFYKQSCKLETDGYGVWPRLKETKEFCLRMGYKKIGFAFCGGLKSEAKFVAKYLREAGLEVVSVMCKAGGVDKSNVMEEEYKLNKGGFEPMCNPITQAELLNEQNTEFNIMLGLCVGHDSLFLANSKALCTVFATKDRALANNPLGAVYTANSYCRMKL